ncbi:energy-coupling factor transporter transmembrane component T family protein [Rhodobacter capsulatus]|jgi:biotin transport system permease protein|uniref:Cobalt ABC transporter, permease protein CbiQ-4 n=1 Tax=Rhodobacter capsulatus (strain ATCC BAA-309 / NBRC 16581 / SB1003) TaxID=272942 RepID=D5AVP0_RHOCB|nr:energy-coupling factor transporter transmembrane protein EcfT [Rhodobacter capsulatus]ADE87375.1 cobalt ABC transporter, permease protein CbiQ-4 [Rhodobacter capsulatus SB 1003]MDS0927592.1 energy-coupling factor transporter transmembrane protein EcfT [Rhodobacter capsulatus]
MSPLHRCPPGPKLAALALAGTGLMLVEAPAIMLAALALTLAGFRLAGFGRAQIRAQVAPLLWMLAILFPVQGWLAGWSLAALVVLRILTLILLAALVTLTTRTEDLIATLERLLAPLAPLGVNPAKVGLALALALRFLPVIRDEALRVREAQAARGLGTHPLALILPLILRVLKTADEVAEAIEARSGHHDGAAISR